MHTYLFTKYYQFTKMKSKNLLFIFFICIITAPVYAQYKEDVKAGMSLERLQRYENFLQKQIETGNLTGAAFLVQRRGEIVHQNALGYNSKEKKKAMKMDNIFFIQSMTKPIITAAFMMLYEEGYFELTDPVSIYLPEFKNLKVSKNPQEGKDGPTKELKREITIAHLLSHTAGFSHGLGQTKLDEDVFKGQYLKEHADIQARVKNLTSMPSDRSTRRTMVL